MPKFSKPLFLLSEDTDSVQIALISSALVYKIAKACNSVIRKAAAFFFSLQKPFLKRLLPESVLSSFPAALHSYDSLELLEEHMLDTNNDYPFTDNRSDLVSKRIQHLANVGALFFSPQFRNQSMVMGYSDDEYFEVATTMLRHIVTADFHVDDDNWVGPVEFFEFERRSSEFCQFVRIPQPKYRHYSSTERFAMQYEMLP